MNRMIRLLAIAGAITLSLSAVAATSASENHDGDHSGDHSEHHHDGVVGHVYVNNNSAGVNSVSGFDRHTDGTLTPISGSPFAIGGAGTGAPTGSQGALQLSHDGRYLIAVDAASNEISVARIRHDGSLRPVSGGPVPSAGAKPVSIAVHDRLVYVANAGPGGSNYTGFTLNGGGRLKPIAGSTFPLPDIANPGDVLFSPNGKGLIGVRVGPDAGPSFIDSFKVGRDGRLTASPGSPFASQVTGPFGSVFSPTRKNQLFVTNAHGGPGTGSVSVFDVAHNGALSPISGSPFANGQTGTCWAEITRDGRYLFAVNTGSTTISRYSVAADGTLALLGNTPITNPGPGGLGAFDVRLSPDGKFLYGVDASGRISAFSVSGGTLTELPSSPVSLQAGLAPFGIVVN